jgi:hypothetical protein
MSGYNFIDTPTSVNNSIILNAWLCCFFGFVVIHQPAFNTYVIRGSKEEYLRGGGWANV